MSVERIVAQLLAAAPIAALIGTRHALEQLPQNPTFPALAWRIVSDTPQPYLAGAAETQPALARVQINPLAPTIGEVIAIHAAVRDVFDYLNNQTIAGHRVIGIRYAGMGPHDKDDEAGVWTRPADYLIHYEE